MTSQNEDPLLNMTLGQFKDVAAALGLAGLANSIKRYTLTTYSQFVDVLYADLTEALSIIQENPELRQEDEEDRLTIEIVSILRGMGYNAEHERKVGGHTDISVRGRDRFLWIGEAKIHDSYKYIFQGFQQLCTRYSTGDSGQDCGGLLIYIPNKNAANVVRTWRKRIENEGIEDLAILDCEERPDMVFYTTHKHERSGRTFKVKHIGVSIYFDPKDHSKAA
ncbi:hypothetical protein [Stutzerimonas xanthomarina]|uniref:hypothetical protein n=1 Tax=Stutzerimonas xanthomarina TaxID=271420 RepID=UPI003AA954EF